MPGTWIAKLARVQALTRAVALVAVGLTAAMATPALAGTANHQRVKVSPIKKGGKTVGARLNLTLQPGSGSRGITNKVAVAIGRAKKLTNTGGRSGYDIVNSKEGGYMRHLFPWLSLKTGSSAPIPTTHEIIYGKGNKFKAGEKVDVYTLWRTNGGGWHLWGSVQFYGNADVVTLPD